MSLMHLDIDMANNSNDVPEIGGLVDLVDGIVGVGLVDLVVGAVGIGLAVDLVVVGTVGLGVGLVVRSEKHNSFH